MNAFYKTLEKANNEEWTKASRDPNRNPTKRTVDKVLELADRSPGTPASVQAKVFAMQISRNAELNDTFDRLQKDILQNHITSPDIESVASMMGLSRNPSQKEQAIKTLKEIEQKSPHANVRAAAISAQIRQVYEEYMGTGDEAAAKRLAKTLVSDYPTTQYGKRAAGLINQIDNLGVGKAAPDIEAEDQDGKKFKLSDYRGKVVVIDFWGWW